jgi:succinate-acetate transporter protein
MANTINFIACGIVTVFLLLSIAFAGNHLLLPAVAMIVTVLIGGLCIYVANGLIISRNKIEKEWEANNPE